MISQKDAGGLAGVPTAAREPAAPIVDPGVQAEAIKRPPPLVSTRKLRHGSYCTVAVVSPLLLSLLKMVLNSCLP